MKRETGEDIEIFPLPQVVECPNVVLGKGCQFKRMNVNRNWNTGPMSLGLGWVAAIAGAWLVASPFVLGFAHTTVGVANNVAVGIVLILLTIGSSKNGLLRALLIVMGGWLFASSVILPVPFGSYLWNNLILAFVVIFATVASETPYPDNYRISQ
jgi:hypothetical protein